MAHLLVSFCHLQLHRPVRQLRPAVHPSLLAHKAPLSHLLVQPRNSRSYDDLQLRSPTSRQHLSR